MGCRHEVSRRLDGQIGSMRLHARTEDVKGHPLLDCLPRGDAIQDHIVPLISKLPPLHQRHAELQQRCAPGGEAHTQHEFAFNTSGQTSTLDHAHGSAERAGLGGDWNFDDETPVDQEPADAPLQRFGCGLITDYGERSMGMDEGCRASLCSRAPLSRANCDAQSSDDGLHVMSGGGLSTEGSVGPLKFAWERFGSIDVEMMESDSAVTEPPAAAERLLVRPLEDGDGRLYEISPGSPSFYDGQRCELEGTMGEEHSEVYRHGAVPDARSFEPCSSSVLEHLNTLVQQLQEQNEQLQRHNSLLVKSLELYG
jgi:hypothetical protein